MTHCKLQAAGQTGPNEPGCYAFEVIPLLYIAKIREITVVRQPWQRFPDPRWQRALQEVEGCHCRDVTC